MKWFKKIINRNKVTETKLPVDVIEDKDVRVGYYKNFLKLNAEPAGITSDGLTFYTLGFEIPGLESPQTYINGQINPLFENLSANLKTGHSEIKAAIAVRQLIVENELKDLSSRLDPANEKSLLKEFDKNIASFQTNEQEMDSIAFPEKWYHRIFKNVVGEIEQESKGDQNAEMTDDELLKLQLSKKKDLKTSQQLMTKFKSSLDDIASSRHSLLHPPRPGFIIFMYSLCVLLLFGEVGISKTIINDYMYTGHSWSNLFFSFIYAISMAASFAILLKILVERTLFTSKKYQHFYFICSMAVAFSVLYIFFSHNHDNGQTDKYKGMILGSFSILFALANAFCFREASYLHHLYLRLNGNQSSKKIKKEKYLYQQFWDNLKQERLGEMEELKQESRLYDQMADEIQAMIGRLKTIIIKNFLKGCDDKLSDIVNNNEELNIVLRAKIRNYLQND